MRSFILNIAVLLMVNSRPAHAQPALPAGLSPANFHLYVLAGQSNMAGRGAVETADQTPHPRVWMLNRENQWVPATDPMHFDKPDIVGVGPGLTFGKLMAEQDTTTFIGLIPTAVGGSPIDAWQPGAYYEPTKSHPYDDAIERVQLAQKTGTLHGILWHQGESDCVGSPEQTRTVAGYEQKLINLIGRFRQAFNSPFAPVVVGTLGDFYTAGGPAPKNPAAAQINDILRKLPKHESRVACVDASGLTDKGDATHFDTTSARELGRRYAKAMQTLEQKKR